ncbi:MAG: alkaline phosphatase family protein [Thermoanaerobaculia bacterium]
MREDGTSSSPLVVFGFDAGDPGLLLRWSEVGTLSTLKALMKRGCWGKTAGPEMFCEHGMWVSLMSGESRSKHGYHYFRQLVSGTYDLAPARGRFLDVEPFWRRLDGNKRVAVIDVPDIAAPKPQSGIQLSEWATHYPYFEAATLPAELLQRIEKSFGPRMVIHEKPESTEEEDREIYRRLMERIRKKGELCRELLTGDRFDLIVVVFGECHTGGHQFWKYLVEGDDTAPKSTEMTAAVKNIYKAIDGEMGLILEALGADPNVFVVSSVGLKPQWPAQGLNEAICWQLGYQHAPEGPSGFSFTQTLRQLLPQSWRDLLSRALSREAQEKLISEKFRSSTEWSRTRIFSIPSLYTGQFRVNLKGREPQGTVEPGEQYEAVLDELEGDLKQLIDPVTGRAAIKTVYRTARLFGIEPPRELPDLFAEWQDAEHFVDHVVHPRGEIHQGKTGFHRGTDHSPYGFFAASGPGVSARGDQGEIDPLDLVPTLLSHFQIEAPELPGRAMKGIAQV